MNTKIQGSSSKTSHDNRSNSSPAAKESQDNAAAASKLSGKKEANPAVVRPTASLKITGTTGNKIHRQETPDQNDDEYNGINIAIQSRGNGNYSEHQAVQRVKAMILDPEAESAADATTLMLLMVGIMGGFQRANMNAAISTLQSIVAKISTRIAQMNTDMVAAYNRDMCNFGAELFLNGTSLAVSSASLAKIQPLRNELVSEQNNLAKSYEFESLKASKSALLNGGTDKAGKPITLPRDKLTDPEKDQLSNIEKKMEGISSEFNEEVPPSYALKSSVDILQTKIAPLETYGQFFNSVATFLKGALTCTVAVLNKDATTAKIAEQAADMEKAQLEVYLRRFLELDSIYRDTQAKFLNQAEQMQNLRASDSTAISHRMG